ncbi:MAG: hypothetical protein FWF29_05005 [Treponema sp.]|nr:hypothetical protein [Treponema sp.]
MAIGKINIFKTYQRGIQIMNSFFFGYVFCDSDGFNPGVRLMVETQVGSENRGLRASRRTGAYRKHTLFYHILHLENHCSSQYNRSMCWYCGEPVTDEDPIGRSLRCTKCGKDLRSCKNCRFYVTGSRGDCSESGAQPPADRELANFCDWFSLNPAYRTASAGKNKDREQAAKAKSAFDNLFTQ